MPKKDEKDSERILILCVDRDNDIGLKADFKTPIVGKEKNKTAATKLILADPEEADANSMFEAIRIYNKMKKEVKIEDKEQYQIATIAGLKLGGISADKKLVSELNLVLSGFPANSLILVTDGFSDEDIIPLIQSRIPITSVKRVVVKHSEALEETAAVFSRYLRMLLENPKYSRIALGLPGILLITLGVLSVLGVFIQYDISTWAWIIGLIIVGIYLIGKGYGLDKTFLSFFSRIYSFSGLISSFSFVTGLLLIGISLYQAWSYVASEVLPAGPLPIDLGVWLELIPKIVGWLISKSLTITIIGLCIIYFGRSLAYVLEHDSRFWRNMGLVFILIWSWNIFNEISIILVNPMTITDKLIIYVIIGIVVIFTSGFCIHFLKKKYHKFFEKTLGKKK
jgi:putative membrane protein